MTVSSSTDRATFPGNGVATAFSLPFRFFANSDVVAQAIVDSTGVATPLTLGVDYLLTGAGQPEEAGAATGVLTTSAPVPIGVSLFAQRIIPATQPTDIVNQGRFFPEVHETVFDRLTMLVQQGEGALSRTLRVQDYDPVPARLPGATQRANRILSFDENGSPVAIDAARDSSLFLRQELANSTDQANGAGMVGWKRAQLSSTIGTVAQMLSAQKVSIWEFAHLITNKPFPNDPNSWDWTPALQAAADSLPSFELPTNGDIYISIPKGRYKIGSVDLGYRRNLIFEGGVLAPLDTVTARTHMIKLGGRNRILNLTVDADYATNYDTIVWCRGRYIDIISPEVWKAKCVFVFGDPAWEGVPASGAFGDSEINIIGGSTNWCITNARAYGQNTIVQYVAGHQAYSYKWTLPGGDPRKTAWEALPEYTFINVGAVIYLTGCFTGNFSGQAANFLSKIQPSDAAEYFNIYGRFHVTGTHIETGKFLTAADAGAVAIEDPKTTMLTMVGCSGYVSSGPGFKIDLQNSLQGVDIRGCKFYGVASNNICYSVSADVHIDPDCFTMNTVDFAQTLEVRYPVGFAGFNALDANGTTQTLVPAAATLKMPSILAADVHPTFRPLWYSSDTGIFTAQTTLRNVVVSVHLTLNGALATDATEFVLYVGGALFAIAASSGSAPWANFSIPKLVRGQTVEVRCGSSPGRACFGGTANFMRISCSTTSGAN